MVNILFCQSQTSHRVHREHGEKFAFPSMTSMISMAKKECDIAKLFTLQLAIGYTRAAQIIPGLER